MEPDLGSSLGDEPGRPLQSRERLGLWQDQDQAAVAAIGQAESEGEVDVGLVLSASYDNESLVVSEVGECRGSPAERRRGHTDLSGELRSDDRIEVLGVHELLTSHQTPSG
jgi:hypothetical protein